MFFVIKTYTITQVRGRCKRIEEENREILFFVCLPKFICVFKRLGGEGCSCCNLLILLDIFGRNLGQSSASL